MTRFLGIFGLAAGFLIISPKLRYELLEGLGQQRDLLREHSPYSYVALGATALVVALVYMYRCAKPR